MLLYNSQPQFDIFWESGMYSQCGDIDLDSVTPESTVHATDASIPSAMYKNSFTEVPHQTSINRFP